MYKNQSLIPSECIINRIFLIRGKKVMFDRDLAELYGAETRILNQAVRRNKNRFPVDFMFQLNEQEWLIWKSQIMTLNEDNAGLRSQIVTSNKVSTNLKSQFVISSWGGARRGRPYVFTEQGVAMLSSVLNSQRAIRVNIAIMRTFTKLREILLTHKELREKIEKLERKYDKNFRVIFEVIKKLIKQDEKSKPIIGFK